jgi:hypothetical protein
MKVPRQPRQTVSLVTTALSLLAALVVMAVVWGMAMGVAMLVRWGLGGAGE